MNLDKRVRNRSLCTVRCFRLADEHGRDVATAIAKLNLYVSKNSKVKRSLPPEIRLVDEPTFLDRPSSLRKPSDLVPAKPGTDVLVLATACPPSNGARQVDVSIRAGSLFRELRVFGPRVWQAGALRPVPGPPADLSTTPLIYELTYGGIDASDPDLPVVERRNPVGMGVARDPRSLVGQRAPSIEDPQQPLGSRKPAPAGIGPVASNWSPRAEHAGTFDEAWRRTRAPVWPTDFDARHYACASPGLWSQTPLSGSVPVEICGTTAGAAWRFSLPAYAPRFSFCVAGKRRDVGTHLDTVLIDADHLHVELSWRATIPLPRRVAAFEEVEIMDEGLLPSGAFDLDVVELRRALGIVSPHD